MLPEPPSGSQESEDHESPMPPTVPYYQDALITLYHGDCLEIAEWLTADVLVTDPPYGINWRLHGGGRRVALSHKGIQNDHDTSARDRALELWGTRPGLVFGTWNASFPRFKQVLVWQKSRDAGVVGAVTGYRRDTELIFLTGIWPKSVELKSSVITTTAGLASYRKRGGHPHAKPVDLMARLLKGTTGTVADPFAGQGATLVAARETGRTAIGVELDEGHCEAAAKRLVKLS